MTIWKAALSAIQTGPDLLSQEWCLYPVSFLCDRINYISFMEGFMDLLAYIIICPLVFLAGFVDAVAGGGGLISLLPISSRGSPYTIPLPQISSAPVWEPFSPRENSQKTGSSRGSPHWQESSSLLRGHHSVPISPLFLTPVYS